MTPEVRVRGNGASNGSGDPVKTLPGRLASSTQPTNTPSEDGA